MFWNFFKRKSGWVDTQNDGEIRRKKPGLVILLIITAICLLAFSGGGEKKRELTDNEKNITDEIKLSEYTVETEERLKAIISGISGAGEVEVMVSFDYINEKILATNSKNENSSDTENGKSVTREDLEENIMVYGSGSGEQPYVLKEKLPVPSGVLVLASGAADEGVRLEIYEAVKALYGMSGHRIKVARLMEK